MTQIRTIAPTVLAVTLDSARANLRVDGTDLDALITTWVKGITADLEHHIGQCLMEQTWEVHLPVFPVVPCHLIGKAQPIQATQAISLPHPVISITSVQYLDEAGVEQTLDSTAYRMNVGRYASTLTPARGATWPATAEDEAAVVVTLQCGYGSTPDKTPENVQLYILAKLVEQFDPHTRTERDTVQSVFVDGLLDACRSYA